MTAALSPVGIVASTARHPRSELAGAGGDMPGPIDDIDDPAVAAADTGLVLVPRPLAGDGEPRDRHS